MISILLFLCLVKPSFSITVLNLTLGIPAVTLATSVTEWATASAPLSQQSGVLPPSLQCSSSSSSEEPPELEPITAPEMSPQLLVLRLQG